MKRLRGGGGSRQQVRIGAADPAGMLAVSELVERLGVVVAVDAAVGPIKQRARGLSAGEFLIGLAAAQMAGAEYLVGLDRRRADTAGALLSPVPTTRRRRRPRWPNGSTPSPGTQ